MTYTDTGRRPPVLDDTDHRATDYLWADAGPDWVRVATDRAATIIRQTQELDELQHRLSVSETDQTIWRVLALVGWTVAVLACAWRVMA